jgi:alginate O-acetyltransferase complex protein AlgI
MLFNSYEYIFLFLPFTLLAFQLCRIPTAARSFLVLASLFFYAWWRPEYLPLLVVSTLINYAIGTVLGRKNGLSPRRKALLGAGLVWNIGLLAFFKYADFTLWNLNFFLGTSFSPLKIVLPLAISFFTFQKIAYLIDSYRGETKDYDFINYLLFVSFFPQLIAGPIVHHKEIISQFKRSETYRLHWDRIACGLSVFVMGLAKKVLIADSVAPWANKGFDVLPALTWIQAWATALAYTIQLYFDFSGYSDMAIGSALMFNIRLPENFNSPYQSTSLRDFWRRWHMTLSRFLRDYVYIPLGGNRVSTERNLFNLVLTFLIGGLWHGAAWTFVFWGFLHGIGVAVESMAEKLRWHLPRTLSTPLTFLYVMLGWVFFRAANWRQAMKVLTGLVGGGGSFSFAELKMLNAETVNSMEALRVGLILVLALLIAFTAPNTRALREFTPRLRISTGLALLFVLSAVHLHRISEFLYFNF